MEIAGGFAALASLAKSEQSWSSHPVAAENANLDLLRWTPLKFDWTRTYCQPCRKTYLAGNQTLGRGKVDLASAQADFQSLTADGQTPIL